MPLDNAKTVTFNHPVDGEITAWVEGEGEGGPGNHDLVCFPSTSPVEHFKNVPHGKDSGEWS